MKYVGIDLGTTNSAICTYDGETVRLYKSPDTHDVTPSAIFVDRRGNRYVGARAYNNAARNPDNAAVLFKRLMGTSTPINLSAVNLVMTPEDCSAEILKTLFGYLPEELRNDPEIGTVITVPAAFNQMQTEATLAAAGAAGIGKVALMQEPVAAVMSVMRQRKNDGVFLVYDLGGGTLDVAIAQSISGRVSLMSHGGVAMCGGRDFDRKLFDSVVKPWLLSKFRLPEQFGEQFKSLTRLGAWAAEKAKIELSQREETVISLPETELGVRDLAGEEIYLDIPLDRKTLDRLIADKIAESIQATREALDHANLSPHDVERIVFVGGPTQYKPLRDKVAFELGIAASTDVNPMTAVAEGAAVFAESIDWSTKNRSRKTSRGTVSTGGSLDLSLNFVARTPDVKARLVVRVAGQVISGSTFQVDSLETGWTSGKVTLKDGASIDLVLSKPGENTFKVFVFDPSGGPLALPSDRIVITRTAASIDAIPSSHSIGIEATERLGGRSRLAYLVTKGDQLPAKGKKTFKAAESLKAGSSGALRFKLWQGDIADSPGQNVFIGMLEIKGSDFSDGVIAAGADLVCTYEMQDSGAIRMEVEIPSIKGSFSTDHNFYSHQEGLIDYSNASKRVADEATAAMARLDSIEETVDDARLNQARDKLDRAASISARAADPEETKQAMDDVQEAKRLLSQTRTDNLPAIRQLELDAVVGHFDENVREHARPTEESAFDNLAKTAQRAINSKDLDFEVHLDDLRSKNFMILWRQDWFVVDRFKRLAASPHLFASPQEHAQLVAMGLEALKANDPDKLRIVTAQMFAVRISSGGDDDIGASANIIQG